MRSKLSSQFIIKANEIIDFRPEIALKTNVMDQKFVFDIEYSYGFPVYTFYSGRMFWNICFFEILISKMCFLVKSQLIDSDSLICEKPFID